MAVIDAIGRAIKVGDIVKVRVSHDSLAVDGLPIKVEYVGQDSNYNASGRYVEPHPEYRNERVFFKSDYVEKVVSVKREWE